MSHLYTVVDQVTEVALDIMLNNIHFLKIFICIRTAKHVSKRDQGFPGQRGGLVQAQWE